MSLSAILLLIVPFVFMAVLPRWRYLLPAACLAVVLHIWAWGVIYNDEISGLGSLYAIGAVTVSAVGSFFGFTARATHLVWAAATKKKQAFWPFLVVSAATPILIFSIWSGLEGYDRRAPSQACQERMHTVKFLDGRLKFPLLSNIDIGTVGFDKKRFRLEDNEQARSFCELTQQREDLDVGSLRVSMGYGDIHRAQKQRVCAQSHSIDWANEVCKLTRRKIQEKYPTSVTFYSPGQLISAFRSSLYRRLTFHEGDFRSLPKVQITVNMTAYIDENSRDFYVPVSDKPRDVVICFKRYPNEKDSTLDCAKKVELSEGAHAHIRFETSPDNLLSQTSQMEHSTQLMWESMRSP